MIWKSKLTADTGTMCWRFTGCAVNVYCVSA
jgi:hypothetical protein